LAPVVDFLLGHVFWGEREGVSKQLRLNAQGGLRVPPQASFLLLTKDFPNPLY